MGQINGGSGPTILLSEVQAAINGMKEGKAAGPDNIHVEFVKLLNEKGLQKITNLFNKIYSSGNIPHDWLVSEFIALPKKPGAKQCEDHHTISLMSHLLKVFLKIIHRRIYKRCEEQISRHQFGFVNAVGTREALFAVNVMVKRSMEYQFKVR